MRVAALVDYLMAKICRENKLHAAQFEALTLYPELTGRTHEHRDPLANGSRELSLGPPSQAGV